MLVGRVKKWGKYPITKLEMRFVLEIFKNTYFLNDIFCKMDKAYNNFYSPPSEIIFYFLAEV